MGNPVTTVAVAPPVAPPATKWWNTQRRKALEMAIDGVSEVQIAKELKVTRKAVYNWKKHPEFRAALRERAEGNGLTTKMRRISEISLAANLLVRKGIVALEKGDLNKALPMLREFRAFRQDERQEYGEQAARIGLEVSGGVEHQHEHKRVDLPFKKFLETNAHLIDVKPELPPNEQLADVTLQLLQKTDLLDQLHAEDAEDERARLIAKDKEK